MNAAGGLAAVLFGAMVASAAASGATRIKDVSTVLGVRPNFISGYGLVIGLNGTGDNPRNAPFTQQSAQSMLDRIGVNIRGTTLRTRNIAAVMVTAELPAFGMRGERIDVNVASLGDATSLQGGQLVMTSLSGADDAIYAVAQGPLVVGALSAAGRAETVSRGTATSGKIPGGALVERSAPGKLNSSGDLSLQLRNPDFKTAIRAIDTINDYSVQRYHRKVAFEVDPKTIELRKPNAIETTRFLAEIGDLRLDTDTPARIVLDERTGTIVIGSDVRIAPVAVSHGGITVRVTEGTEVSQPAPLSPGQTVVVPVTTLAINEAGGNVAPLQGTSLQAIVTGLNRMGLKPSGIIAVLQAIHAAGALNAEIIVQ